MNNSYWIESTKDIKPKFNRLNRDIKCDVCIIGGGITGITTAYKLVKQNYKVIILEKNEIGSKTTGNTTGKLTSQHNLFYSYLLNSKGREFAKKYLQANEKAINEIEKIINKENINCNFVRTNGYVFTEDESEIEKLKIEAADINSLDFSAKFLEKIDIPIENFGGIEFLEQASFHPLKYLYSLANCIVQNKGEIYENSAILDVEKKDNLFLSYTKNHKIESKYVVIATRYPFLKIPGFYFLKMYQLMSYLMAYEIPEVRYKGMYISSKEPEISFRYIQDNNKNILIIGGQGNKVGDNVELSNKYEIIDSIAKKLYPEAKFLNKWCTEDSISLDKIPYIGELSEFMKDAYVATGFKKWGITTSYIAADIIVDKINGKENKYEDIFKSTRLEPVKNHEELANMVKESISSLIIERFKIPEEDIKNIPNDTGKIIEYNGNKIGIYKNEKNEIFAVNPVCSHLGCILHFNNLEKTWDCPCHGSRYNYDGTNIYSPGVKDLEKIDL